MENLTLFQVEDYEFCADDFTVDDWETPPEIARKIAALVKPGELALEPFAGRGAIARYLPNVTAIEFKGNRVKDGEILAPQALWLEWSFFAMSPAPFYDVVVTNPPFSRAIEGIRHSLKFLDLSKPDPRLLFLLPGDYFASCERSDQLEALDCHIAHRYRIRGRVGYLQEGMPQNQRQIYDAVYCLKPGKVGATETVL